MRSAMKKQMKFQKIVCLVNLITAALAFFLALGLLTDLYNLTFAFTVTGREVTGRELYMEMQPFNRLLVKRCIIMIVLAVFLFVTRTQLRRKYYISNYIAISASVLVNIVLSALSIASILECKQRFLTEVDFETWAALHEMMDFIPYTESTLWLDLNVAILGLVIASSFLVVVSLIWKIILIKCENKLLSGKIKPSDLPSEV